jgi:divalent metal cation (Fe/Co/Zn/Cd) transporter
MRTALRLEGVTIAWMVVEAGVSIGAAVLARSILLLAFGVDSGVELLSAGVLYWRLHWEAQARPGEEATVERIERRTAWFAGYLLYSLALYVLIQAGYGLWHRHAAETSWWGIGIAGTAALGMPLLARTKIRVAEEIGSRALRADAMESFTCGYLAWVLLAGLLANALFHWWWLDSAAALVLVPFLINEGREAIRGECCGCGHEEMSSC